MFREEGLEEDAIPIEWSRVVQEGLSEEEVFQARLMQWRSIWWKQSSEKHFKGASSEGVLCWWKCISEKCGWRGSQGHLRAL